MQRSSSARPGVTPWPEYRKHGSVALDLLRHPSQFELSPWSDQTDRTGENRRIGWTGPPTKTKPVETGWTWLDWKEQQLVRSHTQKHINRMIARSSQLYDQSLVEPWLGHPGLTYRTVGGQSHPSLLSMVSTTAFTTTSSPTCINLASASHASLKGRAEGK